MRSTARRRWTWPTTPASTTTRRMRRTALSAGSSTWASRSSCNRPIAVSAGGASGNRRAVSFSAPETTERVIVDDAHRLHPGVGNGRADELEAAFLEILRDRHRQRRLRMHRASVTTQHLAVGERPAIGIERLAARLHLFVHTGAVDGGFD